jgi:hypothetical protein
VPTAKQALGYVEEKLRRVFNIAGPIGVTLEPEVKPVVVVDDLRDPGHAFYQGRSWSAVVSTLDGSPTGTGTGAHVCPFHFLDDCIIETVWVFGQLGIGFTAPAPRLILYNITPDEWTSAPPGDGQFPSLRGAWRDRKTLTNDVPPVEAPLIWLPGTTGTLPQISNIVLDLVSGFVPVPGVFPMKLFMPRGSALCWYTLSNIGPISVGMWGRVFPQ